MMTGSNASQFSTTVRWRSIASRTTIYHAHCRGGRATLGKSDGLRSPAHTVDAHIKDTTPQTDRKHWNSYTSWQRKRGPKSCTCCTPSRPPNATNGIVWVCVLAHGSVTDHNCTICQQGCAVAAFAAATAAAAAAAEQAAQVEHSCAAGSGSKRSTVIQPPASAANRKESADEYQR